MSSNVDDRRGRSAKMAGGLGLGGILLVALFAYLSGSNPIEALLGAVSNGGGLVPASSQQADPSEPYQPSPEEEKLATFAKQVLAGTEDIWSDIFAQMGRTYQPAKLVLFTDTVQSGCGGATKQTGPFYCSADSSVYVDLSFFSSMQSQLGAGGDFAYAYVIAHEVGHHVQHLLGTLDEAHALMQRLDKEQANQVSVRLELQADFYAGVWAHHDNARFGSLEDGDIEEAMRCTKVIGDDYLQKQARGYVTPDSFTHGTSASRTRWFKRGLSRGNLADGDTFSIAYEDL